MEIDIDTAAERAPHEKARVYFAVVEADGTETSFDFEPSHRTSHRIEISGDGYEYTVTRDLQAYQGRVLVLEPRKPKGKGWRPQKKMQRLVTVWRRRVRKAGS